MWLFCTVKYLSHCMIVCILPEIYVKHHEIISLSKRLQNCNRKQMLTLTCRTKNNLD